MLDEYERCYTGELFCDRGTPWEIEYDAMGNYIPQSMRKPSFTDHIAKEIVDSVTAQVFGSERFPTINIKTTKDIYKGIDLFKIDDERGEIDEDERVENEQFPTRFKIKLCNENLNRLSHAMFNQPLMNPAMIEATRMALIMGKAIVVPKIIDGDFYLEVINYKWVRNLVMDEKIPWKIKSFSEIYQIETVDPKDPLRVETYWRRRDFDEERETLYQDIPVKNKLMGWIVDKQSEHGYGFCPAVLFEAPNGRSILAGQVDNIKALTYLTNSILSGIKANMSPQWAVTYPSDGITNLNNNAPKRTQTIWQFFGATSVQCMAPPMAGYEAAKNYKNDLRKEIMRACRVDNEIPTSNQQSGSALMIRLYPTMDAIGEYRICFGDKGMVRLCNYMLNMAIIENKRKKGSIKTSEGALIPVENEFNISLTWGELIPVTEDTVLKAVNNAAAAKSAELVDDERAIAHIERYFGIVDRQDMVKKLARERKKRMELSLDGTEPAKDDAEELKIIKSLYNQITKTNITKEMELPDE